MVSSSRCKPNTRGELAGLGGWRLEVSPLVLGWLMLELEKGARNKMQQTKESQEGGRRKGSLEAETWREEGKTAARILPGRPAFWKGFSGLRFCTFKESGTGAC